jgi:hypothetical protein
MRKLKPLRQSRDFISCTCTENQNGTRIPHLSFSFNGHFEAKTQYFFTAGLPVCNEHVSLERNPQCAYNAKKVAHNAAAQVREKNEDQRREGPFMDLWISCPDELLGDSPPIRKVRQNQISVFFFHYSRWAILIKKKMNRRIPRSKDAERAT